MMTVYDHLADFDGDDARRLEAIFEAFEKAWLAGQAPRIADYLPEEGPLRRASLIELVFIDQEYAIKAQSAAKVEDYLGEFPELETDPDLFLGLVTREFRLRVRRGETPSPEEYLSRFPHLGDRIEGRLKAEAFPPPRPPGESTIDLALVPAEPHQWAEPTALPTEEDPRYDQLRFHARGGLGDVYRGRDVELSREVALKRIRLEYSSESRVRRRFLREARLTARLSHPGVVPIHGLIWDRHGQPWYVMRFVEGRTLARAIDDYHNPSATAPDDRPLAFRELLTRFVAVCDAIAFAHSRDVVHRDLKPANVILGEYGETIVLDWGLATTTLTPLADQPPDHLAPPLAHEAEPLTHDGHALGTPAYMSPEQAKGLPAMNRPASDIYGLGAILYKILAGRSTFEGQSWPSFREKIILGHYPPPRQLKPEVPRPLEAICRKAMALEPAQRYETARDLARDLERWLADEPVTAHREPWTLRAGRWARKHRTAVTTAASTALVAAFLIGLFAQTIRDRTRRADADGQATLARVESLEAEARRIPDPARWSEVIAEAIAEARRARSQLESGGGSDGLKTRARVKLADLEEALRVVQRDRQMVNALDEARLQGANIKDGKFDKDAMTDAILAAFHTYGIDLASLAIEDAAARIRSSRIAAELIAALDEAITSATPAIRDRLAAVARLADPELFEIGERAARKDFDGLRHLVDNEAGRLKWGARCRIIFHALVTLDPNASLSLLEAIHAQHRNDFWLNHDLAIVCQEANPPRLELAIRYLYAASALRPASPGVFNNLGGFLGFKGELDAAIAAHREAIRLKPDYAEGHCNLGEILEAQGRFEEALGSRVRGHELGSRTKGWRYPSAQWVRNCRRMIELEAKLPAVLRGDSPPIGPGERLELALLCYHKAQHATSTRFYGQAFAEQPRLAEYLGSGRRYNAACAATLAGSGVGKDDPPPDDSERASFREQALGWLRLDLEIWAKVLDGGNAKARPAIVQTLAHWKTDRDLAGIRDEASLAKLPEAEREAFRALWADVEALRKKAAGAGSPP
jgi:tRNA A-37 threonylcarbamoyl transferase component Bud32/tetratricopeptide (TPR) repeat protein